MVQLINLVSYGDALFVMQAGFPSDKSMLLNIIVEG